VIAFDCDTPLTLYANAALFPSTKLSVAVPTVASTTLAELNGTASNAGPLVVKTSPA